MRNDQTVESMFSDRHVLPPSSDRNEPNPAVPAKTTLGSSGLTARANTAGRPMPLDAANHVSPPLIVLFTPPPGDEPL